MEVHEFLKEHGAFLHYSLEDAAKDRETALRVRVKRQQTPASGETSRRMIVVADTTPINYLILIEEIDLLPKLYGRVIIPRAVNEELMLSRTPLKAEGTGVDEQPPNWVEILSPTVAIDAELAKLDAGRLSLEYCLAVSLDRNQPS